VKLHEDQDPNLHGATARAEHGDLSADHLEYTDEEGTLGPRVAARARFRGCSCPARSTLLRRDKASAVAALRRHNWAEPPNSRRILEPREVSPR